VKCNPEPKCERRHVLMYTPNFNRRGKPLHEPCVLLFLITVVPNYFGPGVAEGFLMHGGIKYVHNS
jgi:hypothetical protein